MVRLSGVLRCGQGEVKCEDLGQRLMIRYAKLAVDSICVWSSVWVALMCESMVWPLAFWYVFDEIHGFLVEIGCDELVIPGRYCCNRNSLPCSADVDLKSETVLGGGRNYSAYLQRWTRLS